jgi:hypothetical protein
VLQRHLADLDTFALAVSPLYGSWAFAERHMGAERVQALLGEPAIPRRRPRLFPRSHQELASILRTADVPQAIAKRARWGLELRRGEGASKLGGRPELPGAWPLHAGHGLTHLASIALAELPPRAPARRRDTDLLRRLPHRARWRRARGPVCARGRRH